MKYIFTILFSFCFALLLLAQDNEHPRQEMRASWVATVVNLDWPAVADRGDVEAQKQSLIDLLDTLKGINLNAIFFQVRTECDALYDSAYEPWSRYLTSTQGLYPGYDPLAFALEETHKRGMELHAWLNPYRVNVSTADGGNYYSDEHIYIEHPEWILEYTSNDYAGKKILNPGLPEVQHYIKEVVGDLLSKYDIDGIHFDDYFYAYGGTSSSLDQEAYQLYSLEGESTGDFRRRSINKMVSNVWDTIQSIRPYVRFGVSPFGIYGNGMNPPGIVGLDAYNVIYCDPLAWLNEGTVDYINPQLYWPTGGSQDFASLLPWWAARTEENGRQLFAGHGIYRLSANPGILGGPAEHDYLRAMICDLNLSIFENKLYKGKIDQWNLAQVVSQINITRDTDNNSSMGSVFFRARDFDRVNGLKNILKEEVYAFPSLYPVMDWKGEGSPEAPTQAFFVKDSLLGVYHIQWQHPEDSLRFVIYAWEDDMTDRPMQNLIGISYDKSFTSYLSSYQTDSDKIAVSTLDRYGNESQDLLIFNIPEPGPVDLIFPEDNYHLLGAGDHFKWNSSINSASYQIEFSDNVQWDNSITFTVNDTMLNADNLLLTGESSFYWRVAGKNISGLGPFSEIRFVETAIPASPELLFPENNATDIDLLPDFIFLASEMTDSIHFQISKGGSAFADYRIVIDTLVASDGGGAFVPEAELSAYTTHYLRIRAKNGYGSSEWSEIVKFKTLLPLPVSPVISKPFDGEIFDNLNAEIAIKWSTHELSSSYLIQIADDQLFTEILDENIIYADDDYVFNGPGQNNWHFIRVAGQNLSGIGEWSEIVKFALGDPSPVEETEGSALFEIFPNPSASGYFNIRVQNQNFGKYQYKIYQADGKLKKSAWFFHSDTSKLHAIKLDFPCKPCIISLSDLKGTNNFSKSIFTFN